jgi:cysteinyl-tRNA synthetase
MALHLHNTLSRKVEPFEPLNPDGPVGMYCCGPTVHDFAHIGNFRTFAFADLVRRYLEFRGYAVTHVMNITDVEDKIIRRVGETGTTLGEYTAKFQDAFFADFELLNCTPPHHVPKATDHIPEMLEIIGKLMERGIAYQAADQSIYFSIKNYQGCGCDYGRLVKLNFEEMRPGERVSDDEYEKESVADFALWKARVPEDGEVHWPSPWGKGRPGWHIECSAMSMKLLGTSFDLHLGGEDLIFPHHEDEIAQSEGSTGKPFVKHWLHGAHLLVEGKKMSKSLGNFFTLRDLLDKGYDGREIRQLMISAHYRETFNFTLAGLDGARTAMARIDECVTKLRETAGDTAAEPAPKVIKKFTAALDDDLNVSSAWGAVFDWVRDCNRRLADNALTPAEAASELAAWERIDTVLGVGKPEEEAPAELTALLEERAEARAAKDFARADAIRDELAKQGWAIEDTAKGARLKRV